MQNLWRRISLIGIDKKINKPFWHEIVLLNRINGVVLLLAILLFVCDIVASLVFKKDRDIGAVKLLLIILISSVHLLLNSFQLFRVSKISIVVSLPFLLLIFPMILQKVSNEYFIWFPYAPVTLSIIPHLIFNYRVERYYLLFTLVIYFSLTFFVNRLLLLSRTELPAIVPIIEEGYAYYKMASVVSFVFINASLFYLFTENRKHEASLYFTNKRLDVKRKELKKKHTELNAQNEELQLKNKELEKVLAKLNDTREKLIQYEKMATLGTLTAGVAHDIVNPINFISGVIQILNRDIELLKHQRGITSDKASKTLVNEMESIITDANQGVDRITGIISSLLTFSYEGKSEVTKNNINDIIESALLIIKSKVTY